MFAEFCEEEAVNKLNDLMLVQILSQCEHQEHGASSLQDELHVKDGLSL